VGVILDCELHPVLFGHRRQAAQRRREALQLERQGWVLEPASAVARTDRADDAHAERSCELRQERVEALGRLISAAGDVVVAEVERHANTVALLQVTHLPDEPRSGLIPTARWQLELL